MRLLAVLLSLFAFHAAAQTEAQQITSTSPQLVSFAGSDANLQSLVNGLSLGQPVTLVTPSANGVLQIATFTPPAALGADTARALEQARTSLIARGITQPSAQQVAVALMGGALPTSAGVLQVPGVLTNSITLNSVQVRNEVATTGSIGNTAFGGSAANLQSLSNGLRAGAPITLTGTGANGVAQTVTFTAPGGPMSAVEANQALALANQSLAAQGILTPTPEQIRVALLGGTLIVAGGSPVALQGVLQGRTRNVSDSTNIGTSNSNSVATSNSPTISGAPTVSSPIISSPPTPISGAGAGGTTPTDGVRRPSTSEGVNRGNVTGR